MIHLNSYFSTKIVLVWLSNFPSRLGPLRCRTSSTYRQRSSLCKFASRSKQMCPTFIHTQQPALQSNELSLIYKRKHYNFTKPNINSCLYCLTEKLINYNLQYGRTAISAHYLSKSSFPALCLENKATVRMIHGLQLHMSPHKNRTHTTEV